MYIITKRKVIYAICYKVKDSDHFKIHKDILKAFKNNGIEVKGIEVKGITKIWYSLSHKNVEDPAALTLTLEYDDGYIVCATLIYRYIDGGFRIGYEKTLFSEQESKIDELIREFLIKCHL